MSVENINSYNKYQGNGVTTEFSVGFKYNDKTDVKVYLKRYDAIQQETLVENTDYQWINDNTIRFPAILTRTIEVNGEEVEETYTVQDPLDVGDILAIYRETPVASDYNFENQRRLFPEEVTHSDDLAIMLIQELNAMISRSLIMDETSTVTPLELVDELQTLVLRASEYAGTAENAASQATAVLTDPDFIAVSGALTEISSVANDLTNINTIASDINRVNLVADDISSVNTVATDISTVIDVDSNMADINSCASNMTAIQNAPTQATNAANSAASASISAQEAQAAAAKVNNGWNILDHKWSSKKLDDINWLLADTFSWQSGKVYQAAIKHLLKDILMDRFYIIPTGGLGTKFYRLPESDTETQFAWASIGFSTLYTDREFPEVGDNVYYMGQVADTVQTFSSSTSSHITTADDGDKKFYRDTTLDETGYYGWKYNSSEIYYTTSDTPVATDDAYTKSGGVFTATSSVNTVVLPPTAQTETVSGYTITYYEASDGDKIVLSDQESTVLDIYNACGVAWYFIVDATNIRFKLPRRRSTQIVRSYNDGTNWYNLYANGDVEQGGLLTNLPSGNSTQTVYFPIAFKDNKYFLTGSLQNSASSGTWESHSGSSWATKYPTYFTRNCYQANYEWIAKGKSAIDMTSFQADEKYLYFYVGNFTQTALENTAGLDISNFNNKLDLDAHNLNAAGKSYVAGLSAPSNTYEDLTLGATGQTYTMSHDGYLLIQKEYTASYQYISMEEESSKYGMTLQSPTTTGNIKFSIDVRKGQVVKVNYNAGGTTQAFRLIYSVGEV